MEASVPGRLAGSEIHGFRTMEELDVGSIMEEAGTRWLRTNEIHAILFNRNVFSVNVKPVNLPKSGTIVLFDRKMLRNFRKDGHNWKKKKDGKTVKEAHEHLKVGNDERIHVYYAHGQDNPNFVRRCYWLLDKSLEHIVLVHYRETQELQGSPATPVNSNSTSGLSDPPGPWILSEGADSSTHIANSAGENEQLVESNENGDSTTHLKRLHDINTLEWDELLVTNEPNISAAHSQANDSHCVRQSHYDISGSKNNENLLSVNDSPGTISCQVNPHVKIDDGLQTQDSFGRWMNYIISDSPGSVDDPLLEYPVSVGQESFASPVGEEHISSGSHQIFSITDVSPSWAFSTEETKVIVLGYFHEEYSHLARSNLFCVCGDVSFRADMVQIGVYRCFLPPHSPGIIGMYLSIDGNKPISQVTPFEYRTPLLTNPSFPSEDIENSRWEEFRVQMRLAHLLFSSSKSLNILSSKVSQSTLKEAKKFQIKTSHLAKGWASLVKSIENNHITYPEAKDGLFLLALRDRLREWLLERVTEGRTTTERDAQGQGVIHLCAILEYTWAVLPYTYSGLSVDYRDKYGWTALHWAAYYGREKMVAVLLSVGAKAILVTDPTPENPGGLTAADLASSQGHDGLAAYLAEKSLVEHFKAMTIAGNVSGSLQINTTEPVNTENLSEEELNLKDSLAAYRTAADAAARIQAALREHSLKLRTAAIEISNPETEARNIIAAMKIQHAYRNHETRKKMAAAARIQHRFRTWKIRRDFINLRRQTVRIQAIFRGFQVRRQYRKITWSVGVLEKAILRWRLKRKGFRGLQVETVEAVVDENHESETEEEFFRVSRKQAEERVERSVVRVQAMFRSKQAQQEYRRMKLAHNEATLEFEGLLDDETEME